MLPAVEAMVVLRLCMGEGAEKGEENIPRDVHKIEQGILRTYFLFIWQ